MPVLTINSNIKIDDDSVLTELSQLCAKMLCKPENYVMVQINDQQKLIFAGSNDPAASCSLTSLGLNDKHTAEYSQQLCQFMESKLGIPANRIYIEFKSPERRLFGWDKRTF
ncbi:MAG: phenylpyruvate tautomerase MIF-related protein [Gammaproteobacteria bacterium]|nr:phenylpyruvate tautomerase MIF-related protein [Gammaproteobacteria bacterium]